MFLLSAANRKASTSAKLATQTPQQIEADNSNV